jgi:carboxymethylenebutenolidase
MPAGTFETLSAGNRTARLYAVGAGGARSRVVVYHAWWGLNDDVTAYADRLAGAGFSVVAPDLVNGALATTPEDAERLVEGRDESHGDAVALAAIDAIAGGAGARVGLVGFSFGAAHATWAASQRPAVAASVVYYGAMTGPSLAKAKVPVLGHFAETDPYEPEENVRAFEQGLREAGREGMIHRYPGTGHWFAEPSRDAFRAPAADLAFARTVQFLADRL